MNRSLAFAAIAIPTAVVFPLLSLISNVYTLGRRGAIGCLVTAFVMYWVGFLASRAMRGFDTRVCAGALAAGGAETLLRLIALIAWLAPFVYYEISGLGAGEEVRILGVYACYLASTLTLAAGLWERPLLARWRALRGLEEPAADDVAERAARRNRVWQVLGLVLLAVAIVGLYITIDTLQREVRRLQRMQRAQLDEIHDVQIAQQIILRELEGGRQPGDERPRILEQPAKPEESRLSLHVTERRRGRQSTHALAPSERLEIGVTRSIGAELSRPKQPGHHLAVFRWLSPEGHLLKLEAKAYARDASPATSTFRTFAITTPGRYRLQVIVDGALLKDLPLQFVESP